jgi:hypothetical protein
MKKGESIYSIDLVNSEGPLLRMIKSRKSFILVDQWKFQMATLTKDEVMQFFNGELEFKDSQGRNWNFPSVSDSMRTPMPKILSFIGDKYSIDRDELYAKYMDWVNHIIDTCDWKTSFEPAEIVHAISKILEENPELITKNN